MKLAAVRLSVESTTSPPGRVTAAIAATNSAHVGNVLDHLRRDDEIECGAAGSQCFDPDRLVVDLDPGLLGVPPGGVDVGSQAGRSR